MATMEPLCQLIKIHPNKFSKQENLLLEIELFSRLVEEAKHYLNDKYFGYLSLLKLNKKEENDFMEVRIIQDVILDILNSSAYSLEGIAYYTDTPEEVICDLASGVNKNPSSLLLRRIMELHRAIRPELYQMLFKKILDQIQMENLNN